MSKRSHGKPKSQCHNAPLRVVYNDTWTEFYCTEEDCGKPVHPDGRSYSYLVRDPAHAGVTQRTNSKVDQ